MDTHKFAIVPHGVRVSMKALTQVSAALQKQVARDLAPIHNVSGVVSAFTRLADVPIGYWPALLSKSANGGGGYHTDENGQPFIVVAYDETWPLTLSHEICECIPDPWGNSLVTGDLLLQAIACGLKPQRVRYLKEICDPCESAKYGYFIDGVPVSDFYTPAYFEPVAPPGARFSFTGAIKKPKQVLPGGYISWMDAKSNWWQLRMFPDEYSRRVPHVVNLGKDTEFKKARAAGESLRAAVDRATHQPKRVPKVSKVDASKDQGVVATEVRKKLTAMGVH